LWRERYLSALGVPESIHRITERDLQTFYDAHYTPANISIVGVGGLTLSELASALLASPFGEAKPGKRTTLPEPITEFPAIAENRNILPSARFWNFKVPKHATGAYNSTVRLPGNIPSPIVDTFAEMLGTELQMEIRGKNSWGYAPGCGLTDLIQFQELDFGCSALPHRVLGQVDQVIDAVVGSMHEKRELFESVKRQSIAKTHLLDVTAQKIRNGAVSDLSHYGRIHSLKEDVETLESWSFEDFRQILRLLAPSERRTIIRVPYALPQIVKEKFTNAWEWLTTP
jgi:predicted Zn-dependent peptidase